MNTVQGEMLCKFLCFYLVRFSHFTLRIGFLPLVYLCLSSKSRFCVSSLVLGEEIPDSLFACSLQFCDFCSVFVHFKSGHALNTSLLGDISCCVYIDLFEGPASISCFSGHCNKNWSNALAGWAPGCREVDNHWLS